jgi:hypothetical protein
MTSMRILGLSAMASLILFFPSLARAQISLGPTHPCSAQELAALPAWPAFWRENAERNGCVGPVVSGPAVPADQYHGPGSLSGGNTWQGDINWCHHDTDGASLSCAQAWAQNVQCIPGGLGKRCIIETAIVMAKADQCEAAFATALSCQCDGNNSGFGRIQSAGIEAVCDYLKNGVQ